MEQQTPPHVPTPGTGRTGPPRRQQGGPDQIGPQRQRGGPNRSGDELPVRSRLGAVLAHTRRYAFQGQARLAKEAGVSRSAVSRLARGEVRPSFALVWKVTGALETALDRPLDPREWLSFDDRYPTASVCALCGCPGCLPDEAYDADGQIKPAWKHVLPGTWTGGAPT